MNLLRFARSVIHTPFQRLANRLRLLAKRKVLAGAISHLPVLARPRPRSMPGLADTLPQPLLPHLDKVVPLSTGCYEFHLLHQPKCFQLPIEWHRSDLNTGTRLWKLHLHYFDYLDQLRDEDMEALVLDWIDQNRPYRPNYWLDSWNSYAMSIRLVAWMGEFARRRSRLSVRTRCIMLASISEQLAFLLNNMESDIGGNHIIRNIKALYWGNRFFVGQLAERCRTLADKILKKEIDEQILTDGFHFELSPAYHAQVFGDLMDCWRLMAPGTLRDTLGERMAQMAQVTVDMTHTDGRIALFNDGGLDMTWSSDRLLDVFSDLFGIRLQERSHCWFEEAGYCVLRDEDFCLIYDLGNVGPPGLPAHSHGDIFAFELTVGGKPFITDTGVYEYNSGSLRSLSRATRAHNTLTLDDMDQCEFWGAFRMGRRAKVRVNAVNLESELFAIDAEHTGYCHLQGRPVHQRTLDYRKGYGFTVTDVVRGGDKQLACSRLHVHPNVKISRINENEVILLHDDAKITIASASPIRVEEAVWWPNFGKELATHALNFNYGSAPGRWHYVIRLSPEG